MKKWVALKNASSITKIDTYLLLFSLYFWFQA